MNSPKKIGIWGSGVVGRSAIKYFLKKNFKIALADKSKPDGDFLDFLHEQNINIIQKNVQLNSPLVPSVLLSFGEEECIEGCGEYININFYLNENIIDFLESCDQILASPGIDLRKYSNYSHKWLTEADIFAANWKKPIIAVTGTIGKTSIVTLLSKVLEQNNIKVATGGNIGTGMLDLLEIEKDSDLALLELSSFQLEHCKSFAPDLAIITNIFPNHLDRHGDMQNYINAKFNIFRNQKVGQKVLLPEELTQEIEHLVSEKKSQEISFFSSKTKLSHVIPDISYPINWVIIFKACELMGIEIKNLDIDNLEIPDHRVEFIREFNGIEFYDDSKSTVCQATLAAVEKLKDKPIILFLGGISKGVDRSGLVKDLKNKVSQIICFGSEAEELNKFCLENSIPSTWHKTLEESFLDCLSKAQTGSRVLFSPSGASFDLFKDYKDRGDKFKNLVKNLK